MKNIKSISKRFKITSTGKLKYKSSNLRHLLTKKNRKRKIHLKKKKILHINNCKRILISIPYK